MQGGRGARGLDGEPTTGERGGLQQFGGLPGVLGADQGQLGAEGRDQAPEVLEVGEFPVGRPAG